MYKMGVKVVVYIKITPPHQTQWIYVIPKKFMSDHYWKSFDFFNKTLLEYSFPADFMKDVTRQAYLEKGYSLLFMS